MKKYNHKAIEKRWQKTWEKEKLFEVKEGGDKKKFYSLIEFPYPSGEGLHVGHPRPFTAMDVISRKKRMEGFNVLYPIGFDAFGLPTENYAIKTKKPPAEVTKKNIANFTRQLKSLGYSFDWSRQVDTTDPKYYKWTQWIFLQFFKHGLAYKKSIAINWCPKDKIGLANEEVVNGKCERCGTPVEKREKEQWMLAITKYADKLLEGLKEVDYIPQARIQQENWIGRSEGATVRFGLQTTDYRLQRDRAIDRSPSTVDRIEVFTTRPDTLFGATYMVLAPENLLIKNLKSQITNFSEVNKYIEAAKHKSDLERTDLAKEKTGVELKGVKAINPVNGEELPIFVADYVLTGYGTGAIMAVPAHDERDFEFAKKFGLAVREVVKELTINNKQLTKHDEAFVGEGQAINSDFINGLQTKEAKEKIIKWLEEKGIGRRKVQFKLRDWVFSRQRYWGEPIPLVYCERCKEQGKRKKEQSEGERLNPGWIPLPESELPLELPKVKAYEPTDTGESPLSKIEKWVNTKCPHCGGPAKRETDTMPNWAGSSWYFLRYTDPHNDKEFASMDKLKYWMDGGKTVIPTTKEESLSQSTNGQRSLAVARDDNHKGGVDWYNGGMEHTVLHLLYSRFWNQFLFDLGLVPTREPYKKRTSHGMILGPDGEKMSKSRGNVINPDEMVEKFGADAFRVYICFMGPFDQAVKWDTNGLVGVSRFLEKVWRLQEKVIEAEAKNNNLTTLVHQTIKKVSNDIEKMNFNTAIAALMELTNALTKEEKISKAGYRVLIKLLSPFAPHIAEELWEAFGDGKSLTYTAWPVYDEALTQEATLTIAVQVNGKVRDELSAAAGISEVELKKLALASEKVQKWLEGKTPKKMIYVKGKLVSIVV